MFKYIYSSIFAIAIIVLNLIYGSIISWFLSITLLSIIFYFVIQLNLEDIVNNVFQKKQKDIAQQPEIGHKLFLFGKKWENILKFSTLSLVFIAAAWCIIATTAPTSNKAWFLNNDYHGISNTGIAFSKNLDLLSASSDSNAMDGKLKISVPNEQASITFDRYYVPVLKPIGDRKRTILNKIYDKPIKQNISFKNEHYNVAISIAENHPNLWRKWWHKETNGLLLNVNLEVFNKDILAQWNLPTPFKEQISIHTNSIEIGKNFFEFILNNQKFESNTPQSFQILETLLQDLGDSYILVDQSNNDKEYYFFPARQVIENNFIVHIDGQVIAPKLKISTTLSLDEPFYLGLSNFKKQLYIGKLDDKKYPEASAANYALYFDYPNTYLLKSPSNQEAGNKNIRFITNNLNKVIDEEIKEGFLFNTYNLVTTTPIQGSIDYYAGIPNTALHLNVFDFNNSPSKQQKAVTNFSLVTQDKSQQYLFQIRDFSNNGFSTERTILYLGIIFIAFLILTIFFPGKKLERIEPIILIVILALTTLRFLLYWRLATFPPLENISKHELEQTLINFDFNLGFQLPIPLTIIWILGMVLLLIIYRLGKLDGIIRGIKNLWKKIIPVSQNVNFQYLIFIGICFAIYFINKQILHIELLVRIITILIPLIGYILFSAKANQQFSYQVKPLKYGGSKKIAEHVHAYFYYFFHNPTTIITITTLLFFGITDRGFAILFFLFLLLKNILINFLKKPLANTKVNIGNRLLMPHNFWIYAILALICYLCLLAIKPLFYYALTYKVFVLFGLSAFVTICCYMLVNKERIKKIALGITIVIGLLAVIPFTNNWLDKSMSDVVKHVQYRASIIYQPIHEMLQANEYTSFKTQKIIETAENQWFINSYISKPYNNDETINLRAHSRVGVDYSTQTRDVVIARYVISEWGDFSMYLILALLILPMVFYLIAYRITLVTNSESDRDISSYTGLVPLLILFTIGLFVWLTATNRFVFFGQDFPFLSLTSKLSVLMPIILWAITLMQRPTPKHSFTVDIGNNSIKYALFVGLIAVFALTTVKKNELNNDNFSIVMETTKSYIENDLNGILQNIQDKMEANRESIQYNKLINYLADDTSFLELKNEHIKDNYTKSILVNLIQKPNSAFQLNNPLFMVYDNGRYQAVYNKNLYLELPPIENRKIWQGNILESIQNINSASAVVQWNNTKQQVKLPFFTHNPVQGIQMAVLPKNWILNAQDNVGIINIMNTNKEQTDVFLYKNVHKNTIQNATSFATTLQYDDIATVYQKDQSYKLGFQSEGNKYATNKWINGNYRIIYPLREQNFWVYSYANAIKSAYSNDSMQHWNNHITIDYNLHLQNHKVIEASMKKTIGNKKGKNYNFSVIGADGDGNIRFMNDYVNDRTIIDPNDQATIFALQQKQFFYSNAKHERDQWGNRNLLNLYLGPGSSIKGLTISAVASQVNAGWENLIYTAPGGEQAAFAGLKLVKPWINDEHYYEPMGISTFLTKSSNYYHLLLMFMGSYTKDDFGKDGKYSLKNVLTTNPGKNNSFPKMQVNGQNYYFQNYATKAWPQTDKSATHQSYFGNENSIIANGFEYNLGLKTKDKDKLDQLAITNDRVNFVDSNLYRQLNSNKNSGYLWGFPEESFFLQSDRASKEIHQNTNLGVFTPSLGGYPFRVTPYKMAEMYLSLFTQNNNLQLSIVPNKLPKSKWVVDDTWNHKFNAFLANNVYKGLQDVISFGTGTRLNAITQRYPQYKFYAKTGTINEQGAGNLNSRRLVVIITDKDVTNVEHVGKNKAYVLYFAIDNSKDFDWEAINNIITQTITSKSFKYYFNK